MEQAKIAGGHSDTAGGLKRQWYALAILLAGSGAAAAATVPFGLSHIFLLRQDLFVLTALVLLLLACAIGPARTSSRLPRVRLTSTRVTRLALVLTLLLWLGTYLILGNHPLSRDEKMVLFDAAVFRTGHLAAPLDLFWRPYMIALAPEFILPIPGRVAWVSAYLPLNAMARAAFGEICDPALLNPLLFGVGAIALYDVGKRLFPEQGAQAFALLIYCTSAQGLAAAMTPYAMTAHLALNLCWLACYLRNSRKSHVGAIGLGFIGIGIHQVIFHPLFALPFIERLRRERRFRLAATYAGAYGLFALFWLSYPNLVAHAATGSAVINAGNPGTPSFLGRIIRLLVHHDPSTLSFMGANLIRFVAWQNLALLPALAMAWPAIRRGEGLARPLASGIVLTIAAVTILMPYQGHGWGYRYLHGFLGSFALLAAYGWRAGSKQPEAQRVFALGTIVTLLWALPFLGWQLHKFVAPYARVDRMLAQIPAAAVVVETDGLGLPLDIIRNDPSLTNRPILLASTEITVRDVADLCRHGPVALVDSVQIHALGVGSDDDRVSPQFKRLRAGVPTTCLRIPT